MLDQYPKPPNVGSSIKNEKLTDHQRLNYLIQYHHNLSIQYVSIKRGDEALNQLKKVEKEIERLLGVDD